MLTELRRIRRKLLAGPEILPADWQIIRNDRKGLVARCWDDGLDLLVKRVLTFDRGGVLVPHGRVAREAEAVHWLGGMAPAPLLVEPETGILIRLFAEGSSLGEALRARPRDALEVARQCGSFLRKMSEREGPRLKPRGIPTTLNLKMRAGLAVNRQAVSASVERMLAGCNPAHGDLVNRNVIVDGASITLIDGETLDRASPAWDMAHFLAAPAMAVVTLPGWNSELRDAAGISEEDVRDAEILSAALCLYWLDEREGRDLPRRWRNRVRETATRTLLEAPR